MLAPLKACLQRLAANGDAAADLFAIAVFVLAEKGLFSMLALALDDFHGIIVL